MPELKTFPQTLEYHFDNVKGIVQIHFKIFVEFSYGDIRPIKFYDILTTDHISLKSQYNVASNALSFINFYYDIFPAKKEFIRISISREDFLRNFKKYYLKFLRKHTGILEKYTKKFDPIARKHLKIIEDNPKITNILQKWIRGELTYVVNKQGEIRKTNEDIDIFFEKLDLHQEDKLQNPKKLIQEMNRIFNKFTRYSKEFTVWRGLNVDKIFEKGDIIENPIPSPTSLLPYTARGFLGNICCLLEITVPKKFPVIFLHKYRFWEKEVILSSCKFEVIETKKIKRKDLTKYLGDSNIPWIQQFKRNESPNIPEYMIIAKCEIVTDN